MNHLRIKNNSTAIFFFVVFAVIVFVMLVVNSRLVLKWELGAPTNGVEKLYTAGGAHSCFSNK